MGFGQKQTEYHKHSPRQIVYLLNKINLIPNCFIAAPFLLRRQNYYSIFSRNPDNFMLKSKIIIVINYIKEHVDVSHKVSLYTSSLFPTRKSPLIKISLSIYPSHFHPAAKKPFL